MKADIKELKEQKVNAEKNSNFANDFSKAADLGTVYPEFLKHCGPKTQQWLAAFFTEILRTRNFHK